MIFNKIFHPLHSIKCKLSENLNSVRTYALEHDGPGSNSFIVEDCLEAQISGLFFFYMKIIMGSVNTQRY